MRSFEEASRVLAAEELELPRLARFGVKDIQLLERQETFSYVDTCARGKSRRKEEGWNCAGMRGGTWGEQPGQPEKKR